MDSFRIASLKLHLIEKIFNKHEEKSHFRLQQTCRWVNEFVQSSRNIHVPLSGRYILQEIDGQLILRKRPNLELNIQGIDGNRVEKFKVYGNNFDRVYDFLKTIRISCKELDLRVVGEFTKEECLSLLTILKPVSVNINSKICDQFETLLQLRGLKSAAVDIRSNRFETVASQLFFTIPDVTIYTNDPRWNGYNQHPFDLIRTAVKLLTSQSFPNLRKFYLSVDLHDEVNYDELKERFEASGPVLSSSWDKHGQLSVLIGIPNGCKMVIDDDCFPPTVRLYYGGE